MTIHARTAFILWLAVLGFAATSSAQMDNLESPESIRARYQYRVKKRLDERGHFSMQSILSAREEIDGKRTAAALRKGALGGWNWEWLGPQNAGGRVQDLLINPFDRNQFWVASSGGGIWHSTNRGLTWQHIDDFLPMLNVVSLEIDPLIPQNMYAGTGEYDYLGGGGSPISNGRAITGVGIYKSTNDGTSWFQLASTNTPDFYFVSRLAHYPATTNRLLAGTLNGVFRTTDGGGSWTKFLTPDFAEAVRDIKINLANPARVLVGTESNAYLTTDNGTNWTRLTAGLRGGMPSSPGRCALAIAPTNTNVMYILIALSTGGDQLWRTTNGGLGWELRGSNVGTANFYAIALWVSPTDPDFVVVGGTDWVARSTDGGTSFSIISDWRGYHNGRTTPGFSPHGDFHVIVHDPAYDGVNNKILFVGDDGGVQRTSDITTVSLYTGWTNLSPGLGITQFYGGAVSPDGHLLVGGTQDLYNVNYYSTKPSWGSYSGIGGWWNFTTGDGGYAAIDPTEGRYIFVESQFFGFDRSIDSGKTYQVARNGLLDAGDPSKSLFVAPFVMDPNYPPTLVAGGTSIWRTTDRASNWSSIRSPVAGNPKCSAIDIYKANSSVIWVGYDNGLISFTTNGGSTWNDAGKPGGTRFVTDIAINPTPFAYAEVIVTLGGYSNNNVWMSSDNGATWERRTGILPDNLPAIQVNTVRYHPTLTNRVYVGTDLGIFASTDKGLHWDVAPQSLDNEGPANTPVEELFWQGTTYLIAATHGRGMFRANPLIVSVPEASVLPTSYALEQNYPNPFNPTTLVRYQLPAVSDVDLVVYDLLGREIRTLVHASVEAGEHEIAFDASGLASGAYVCRLRARPLPDAGGGAKEYIQARKLLLLR